MTYNKYLSLFSSSFYFKEKKKERNLKRCDMDWWVKLLDFDKIWVRVRFTDWDPVQYLGYCTGCNSSNFSPWYNLTATLNWHFIDPCQKKISSSFFPLLSRYTKLKKKKKISLLVSLFNQKNLWLNPFSLCLRISMVVASNHQVPYTTTFSATWCSALLF